MANIEEKIENLIRKPIEEIGYKLYDVEYAKEGKNFFLRIFIDKPEGIDLEDCEKVNNHISDLLDDADYIKEQYFLEVSSPGVEKVLRKDKHLKENIGEKIEVRLFKPIEKEKVLIGILEKFDSDNVTLNIDNSSLEIPRQNISLIKTIFEW